MNHALRFIWMVTTVIGFALASYDMGPVIETTSGPVRGFKQQISTGKEAMTYYGIPFADPPIGEQRFRKANPVKKSEKVLSATQLPNSCTQNAYPGTSFIPALRKWHMSTEVSEDCLYLNIWTPTGDISDKAVMIWLYGGAFTKGSVSFVQYNGSAIATEEDVIVVTINYRVSAFGYLFLDHPKIPGNAGLHDQMMAIRWVKDNIKNFGGNPDAITVFGESAGASSTSLLLILPSNDVFKRAILESGGATCPWATLSRKEALRRALVVAKDVGCPYDIKQKEEIVSCLVNVDPEKLLVFEPDVVDGVSYAPVVDNDLVPMEPSELMKIARKKDFEVLLGTNTNEGTLFLLFLIPDAFDFFENTSHLSKAQFIEALHEYSPIKVDEVEDALEFFYGEWDVPKTKADTGNFQDSMDAMITDFYFVCQLNKIADDISRGTGKSYVYRYEHRSSSSPFPAWLKVFHSHELQYVFGDPLNPESNYEEKERLFSRRIIRYWANFAKTGDPNKVPEDTNSPLEDLPKWPVWNEADHGFMHLSAKSIAVDTQLRRRHCLFIDRYIPTMLKRTKTFQQTLAFYKAYVDSLPGESANNLIPGALKADDYHKSSSSNPVNSFRFLVIAYAVIAKVLGLRGIGT